MTTTILLNKIFFFVNELNETNSYGIIESYECTSDSVSVKIGESWNWSHNKSTY